MQSINNAANAAKTALFGSNEAQSQSGSEPVSGHPGSGSGGEPYDAGNAAGQSGTTGEATGSSYDSQTSQTGTSTGPTDAAYDTTLTKSVAPTVGTDSTYDNSASTQSEAQTLGADSSHNNTTSSGIMDEASGPSHGDVAEQPTPNISKTVDAQQGGEVHPHHDTDKTGVTSAHTTDAQSSAGPLTSSNESNVETRGQARGPVGGVGAVEPSVGADPESGANIGQKEQGTDRPNEEPSGEQVDAIKDQKAKHEDTQTNDDGVPDEPPPRDPNDHSGEPLGTVDHGAPGQGQGDNKEEGGQEGPSEEKGTGEQWVKSTGVAADGGDFDATKPGAGKEAERLLEKAGVHRTQPGLPKDDGDGSDPLDPTNKPSLATKLKDKLHIGHKE